MRWRRQSLDFPEANHATPPRVGPLPFVPSPFSTVFVSPVQGDVEFAVALVLDLQGVVITFFARAVSLVAVSPGYCCRRDRLRAESHSGLLRRARRGRLCGPGMKSCVAIMNARTHHLHCFLI